MGSCDAVQANLASLSALQPAERPAWLREHVAACAACARALWAHQVMQATLEALLLQRGTPTREPHDDTL